MMIDLLDGKDKEARKLKEGGNIKNVSIISVLILLFCRVVHDSIMASSTYLQIIPIKLIWQFLTFFRLGFCFLGFVLDQIVNCEVSIETIEFILI
jgi:hypothetical protein